MTTILVVEDEATILMLVESVLQSAGYETLSAGTLSQAQDLLRSGQRIDLVFTDVHLGDQPEGGILVGEMVRQLHPGTPVIYATARDLAGIKTKLVDPSRFLPKPYTDDKVVAAVAALLRPSDQRTE